MAPTTDIRRLLQAWFRLRLDGTATAGSLSEIDEASTVGDAVDASRLKSRLPGGWCVDREMVQFPGESLAEVVRLTSRGDGYRITLKPVDLRAPTEAIEVYTRASPFEARTHRETVDSLSVAVDEAERLAAAHERRRRQSAGRGSRGVDR